MASQRRGRLFFAHVDTDRARAVRWCPRAASPDGAGSSLQTILAGEAAIPLANIAADLAVALIQGGRETVAG